MPNMQVVSHRLLSTHADMTTTKLILELPEGLFNRSALPVSANRADSYSSIPSLAPELRTNVPTMPAASTLMWRVLVPSVTVRDSPTSEHALTRAPSILANEAHGRYGAFV